MPLTERQAKIRRPVSAFELRRRNAGLTQAGLAELAGVSRPYIAAVERGWVPPIPRQLALAAALGVPATELFPEFEEVVVAKT